MFTTGVLCTVCGAQVYLNIIIGHTEICVTYFYFPIYPCIVPIQGYCKNRNFFA